VLTPALDSGRFIEDTILSVLAQSYPNVEHLVLAAGSTEARERALLDRYSESLTVVRDGPVELSPKLNLGFRLARGQIVGWLNADDVYLPAAVAEAVEALEQDGALALVYSNSLWIDEQGRETRREASPVFDLDVMLNVGNLVPQPSAFVRKDAVLAVGGVDARYRYAQDYDLWIRIARRYPVRRVDAYWAAHRLHPQQQTALHGRAGSSELRRISRRHGGRRLSPLWRRHSAAGRTVTRIRDGDVSGLLVSAARQLRRRRGR